MLFLETVQERLTLISLDSNEYMARIRQIAELGVVGGTVYDALIAQCAAKAKADVIYTWNIRDFKQTGLEISKRIRTPSATE